MADFCRDCSEEFFGDEDRTELSNLLTEEQVKDGFLIPVLCEGCGFGLADNTGRIIKRTEGLVEE